MTNSYPQLVKLGSKWIFQDQTGKQITNLVFDQARDFSEGLAAVNINGKWGYINQEGKVVVDFQLGLAESFSEGLAAVGYQEEYRVYVSPEDRDWNDGRAYNSKYGYINLIGELVIPIQFDQIASHFFQGVAIVGIVYGRQTNGSSYSYNYFFINKNGEKISEVFSILDYRKFSEGRELAAVGFLDNPNNFLSNRKLGFINQSGKIIIPIQFESVSDFYSQFSYVQLNGKHGAIDKTGAIVIPIKFDYIHLSNNIDENGFSEGLLAVLLNNKWGYIDKNSDFVIQPQFDNAYPFEGSLASVSIRQTNSNGQSVLRSGFINKNGQFFGTSHSRKVFQERLEQFQIEPVTDISGKYGYLNKKFELCVPFQFEEADISFSTGNINLARVKKDGKWGYINQQGQVVIETKFEEASPFINGQAKVKVRPKDTQFVTIDESGKILKLKDNKKSDDNGTVWLWLFLGLLLVGLLGYCSSQSGRKSQPKNNSSAPAINLSYKSSCGSYSGKTAQWYAVVGDRASLKTVKSRYCADSFIRKDRNVQVASFTSEQEAQQFANALQQATGYQFWVRVSVRK